jgi:NADH-quinone oxidoreductase subunit B
MPVGLGCGGAELMALAAQQAAFSDLGMRLCQSPRQADVMIVAGCLSWKMAPVIRTLYEQMPEPKWVIAMGTCAAGGGALHSYAVVQDAGRIIPVDVHVPGYPPTPEQLRHAISLLQDKIQSERGSVRKTLNLG